MLWRDFSILPQLRNGVGFLVAFDFRRGVVSFDQRSARLASMMLRVFGGLFSFLPGECLLPRAGAAPPALVPATCPCRRPLDVLCNHCVACLAEAPCGFCK